MVFAPTRHIARASHEPAAAPKRLDHLAPPTPGQPGKRLAWRAVVHMSGDSSCQTAWHVAGCAGHCAEGERLLAANGDPDGHCLVEGACARCTLDH
jgi:hypothetical protein